MKRRIRREAGKELRGERLSERRNRSREAGYRRKRGEERRDHGHKEYSAKSEKTRIFETEGGGGKEKEEPRSG